VAVQEAAERGASAAGGWAPSPLPPPDDDNTKWAPSPRAPPPPPPDDDTEASIAAELQALQARLVELREQYHMPAPLGRSRSSLLASSPSARDGYSPGRAAPSAPNSEEEEEMQALRARVRELEGLQAQSPLGTRRLGSDRGSGNQSGFMVYNPLGRPLARKGAM
jgi:hypothetical protein